MYYIIERMEDGIAVIEREDGHCFEAPADDFAGFRENDVLRLTDHGYVLDENKKFELQTYAYDLQERLFDQYDSNDDETLD